MDLVSLTDKTSIENRLRCDTALHLYEIGDLDNFFWPYTTWYTLDYNPATPVILIYQGAAKPVMIALESYPSDQMKKIIELTLPLLPPVIYAHLTDELVEVFQKSYQVTSRGRHNKMLLTEPSALDKIDTMGVEILTSRSLSELNEFYRRSNPHHWFDSRMVDTGCYFGSRSGSRLVSVAGVHVYSKQYHIGVLGNVATDPYFRGAGLATRVSAGLCRHLLNSVGDIGLNVESTNQPALSCYHRLGFTTVGHFEEYLLQSKSA
jgi:ribosomal protein S18 acetylase RimI-like enzyme